MENTIKAPKYNLRQDIPMDGYLSVSSYTKVVTRNEVGRYLDEEGLLISKRCNSCGKVRMITKFRTRKRTIDRIETTCSNCINEKVGNFKIENPLLRRVQKHNTRNRKGGYEEKLTISGLNNVFKGYRNKCALTKNEVDVSVDSFIPFSWGVPTTIDFVYPLNFNLNSSKGARNPFTFAEGQIEKGTFSRYKWNQLVKELATRNGLKPSQLKKITFEIDQARNEPRIEGYNPVYYKHFIIE